MEKAPLQAPVQPQAPVDQRWALARTLGEESQEAQMGRRASLVVGGSMLLPFLLPLRLATPAWRVLEALSRVGLGSLSVKLPVALQDA